MSSEEPGYGRTIASIGIVAFGLLALLALCDGGSTSEPKERPPGISENVKSLLRLTIESAGFVCPTLFHARPLGLQPLGAGYEVVCSDARLSPNPDLRYRVFFDPKKQRAPVVQVSD